MTEYLFKHKWQQKAEAIETGAKKIAETPSILKPIVRTPTYAAPTPVNEGKVTVTQQKKLQTTTGWDFVAPMISPLFGGAYLLGQMASVGQPTQKTQEISGTAEDVSGVIEALKPIPTPTATTGGLDFGGMGGIIDKVIIAGVVLGAISLLKGVFK